MSLKELLTLPIDLTDNFYRFLSPANEVCESLFLHVSVCPRGGEVRGIPACLAGGITACLAGLRERRGAFQHTLQISRPTPKGELEGSGLGVSRPTPGGSPGPHLKGSPGPYLGVSRPTPRGLQVHTQGSPGPHPGVSRPTPRGSPGPNLLVSWPKPGSLQAHTQGVYPSMH